MELRPIWRFFGADEPNYATMKDGRKLIGELGALRPKQVYFRTHNLLNTGDGTPALKWGSTERVHGRCAGTPGLRLDGARPDLRHLPRARSAAVRADRVHAEGAVDEAGAVSARVATRAATTI